MDILSHITHSVTAKVRTARHTCSMVQHYQVLGTSCLIISISITRFPQMLVKYFHGVFRKPIGANRANGRMNGRHGRERQRNL